MHLPSDLRRPGRKRICPTQGTRRSSVCQSFDYINQPEPRNGTAPKARSDRGRPCKTCGDIETLSKDQGEAAEKSD